MNVDLSRTDVEKLLGGFLMGTQAVDIRLTELADLPPACRALVKRAAAAGQVWTAWMTDGGPWPPGAKSTPKAPATSMLV
jgi:hypothetical protein